MVNSNMVDLAFDGTFDDWRRVARGALANGHRPSTVSWCAANDVQYGFFESGIHGKTVPADAEHASFRLPRQTLTILESAACYRDPQRWDLLYRIVWRLTHGEPTLMEDVLDQDIHRVLRMDKQIRRDVHKMHAFVRFRKVIYMEQEPRYVAWFQPVHDIVLRAAPLFVRRFRSMCWSIITPDISVHWDRTTLERGPGMPSRLIAKSDDWERLWITYYTNIFNPARLKTRAMCAEMPKKYWINLPEAATIAPLIHDAHGRVARFQTAAEQTKHTS